MSDSESSSYSSSSDYDSDEGQEEQPEEQPKSSSKGFGFEMGQSESHSGEYKQKQEELLLGGNITVIFILPNGKEVSEVVKMGHAIESIKVMFEKKYGFPFSEQEFLLNGKELPNVFALNDIIEMTPNFGPKSKIEIKLAK